MIDATIIGRIKREHIEEYGGRKVRVIDELEPMGVIIKAHFLGDLNNPLGDSGQP